MPAIQHSATMIVNDRVYRDIFYHFFLARISFLSIRLRILYSDMNLIKSGCRGILMKTVHKYLAMMKHGGTEQLCFMR